MEEKIKIVLADDEPLFRKGIAMLLNNDDNIEILFEASNGQQLVDLLKEANILPDIAIVDLKMPEVNGVEATRIVTNEFPDVKIIALTSYHTKWFISNMIEVGASSYLVKNTTPDELIKVIKRVYKNGYYYDDYTLKVIDENIVAKSKSKSRFTEDEFTKREIEVLQLICKQFSAAEIADELFLSPRTVEGHKNNLLRKTECKNTLGLIVYALLNGYVTIEDLL